MKLVTNVVQSFKVAKVFSPNTDRINSIDYFKDGTSLVSSSDDDSIVIYDCEKGMQSQTLHSKKYGADFIRYTQSNHSAIHSSNKVDDTIRYLSLHDNKYIRYFPGHTKKVISLSMSPCDNTFLSGSLDKTVRLWDLRSPNCQGFVSQTGRTLVNYDPIGMIFAVAVDGESVKMFDLRTFDKGPFNSFDLPKSETYDWATGLKFSPDSKSLLVSTSSSVIHLIDAYQGVSLQTFMGYATAKGVPLEASFSPDSQFIFSGSTSGAIHVWLAENGFKTAVLQCEHNGPIHCIQFNPKFMMLVSACTIMSFWLPSIPDDDL